MIFIGALLTGATGWSPWITYGIPLIALFLVTIPLVRAVRRDHAEIHKTDSETKPKNGR